jgi:hypothetical protein
MKGYLVGYKLPGGINYCIYYPGAKEFKVSRDVLFDEEEFFHTRHVMGYSEILPFAEISAGDDGDQEV